MPIVKFQIDSEAPADTVLERLRAAVGPEAWTVRTLRSRATEEIRAGQADRQGREGNHAAVDDVCVGEVEGASDSAGWGEKFEWHQCGRTRGSRG